MASRKKVLKVLILSVAVLAPVSFIFSWTYRTYLPVDMTQGLLTVPGPVHLLTLVMVFPVLETDAWKKQGYNISDKELLKKRQLEYYESLRLNVQHPSIDTIHLLSDQKELLREKLISYGIRLERIHLWNSTSNPTYTDVFKFVSEFLQHKLVMIVNADIILGEGFNFINKKWWEATPKVSYVLTRHTYHGHAACKMATIGYCDKTGTYLGSHDAFMFYLHNPLPDVFLRELNFSSHSYGSENVVIWALRERLSFTVSNPCRRLVTYHNHCTNIRAPYEKRTRVNINGKSGIANFTV